MSHFKGPEISQPMFPVDISLFKLLMHSLEKNGNNTALVEGWSDTSVNYSDMLHHSSSLAKGLQKVGVTVGDPVVLCCEKSISSMEILLGVMLSGATPVIIPEPCADKIDHLTTGHTVKAVFHGPEFGVEVAECVSRMSPPPVLVASTDPEDPVMASLLGTAPHELEEYHLEDPKNHIWIVICSSGTTGDPKGVPVKDLREKNQHNDIQSKRTGPVLITTPFHMCSLFLNFFLAISKNMTLVLSDMRNPSHNLYLIEKYKIKEWCEGSATLFRYVKEACPHQHDLSSLEYFGPVGDIMYGSVAAQFYHQVLGKHDVNVFQSYGNTEIGHLTTLWTRASELADLGLGASGTVDAGSELKVVDSEGATVECGVVGEIWAKTPTMNIPSGYWGRPDVTVPVDEEGYFHTGDVGYLDNRGFLYTRGRVVDAIEFRGTKVYAAEIVDELMWHPDVLDAAVVATPHPEDGHHPRALVVLRPGTTVLPADIVTFVDGRVQGRDHLRLRGGVTVVDKLPRSKNGKMARPWLRQLADSLSVSLSKADDHD